MKSNLQSTGTINFSYKNSNKYFFLAKYYITQIQGTFFNLLMPNVNYSGRTAPLTSKVAFYIFIQQI